MLLAPELRADLFGEGGGLSIDRRQLALQSGDPDSQLTRCVLLLALQDGQRGDVRRQPPSQAHLLIQGRLLLGALLVEPRLIRQQL